MVGLGGSTDWSRRLAWAVLFGFCLSLPHAGELRGQDYVPAPVPDRTLSVPIKPPAFDGLASPTPRPGPASAPAPGLPARGLPAAEGLPGPDTVDRPDAGRVWIDPVIDSLAEADRKLVSALISDLLAFEAEIRERHRIYRARFDTLREFQALLAEGYAAERAQRSHRAVAFDLSGRGGNTEFVAYITGRNTPNFVPKAQAAGRPECITPPFGESTQLACYDHQPAKWRLSFWQGVDWFETEAGLYDQDGLLIGPLPEAVLALDGFYLSHAKRLERVLGLTGRRPADRSIFIDGIAGPPAGSGRRKIELAASRDADGKLTLAPGMRAAIEGMSRYVVTARQRWTQYERILAAEHPRLIARWMGRTARMRQEYGALQAPLYIDLLKQYDAIPRSRMPTSIGDAERLHQEWIASRRQDLRRLDAVQACYSRLKSPTRDPQFRTLGGTVFFDPLYMIAEAASRIPAGAVVEEVSMTGYPGDHYVKGRPAAMGIAAPATALDDLPAGGGLNLLECDLRRGAPGARTEMAAPAAQPEEKPTLRVVRALPVEQDDEPAVTDEDGLTTPLPEWTFEPVESIHFGHPFYIEARFDKPQQSASYSVTVNGGRTVSVERVDEQPLLYRSRALVLTHAGVEGARR
jgi:hypothetical protein